MKDQSLRVLMVEDSENDELLIIRELKKGGYNPVYERVQTAAAMKKVLKEKQWEIILCDYEIPTFNAPSAIVIQKESNIDIPFIVVTGTVGEKTVAECMRLGAHDYIMKNNLSRLCPAIARELEDAKVRNKQKQAEEELRESKERFRLLAEAAFEAIAIHEEGVLLNANDQYFKMFGYEPDEALGKEMISVTFAPESLEFVKKQVATDNMEPYEAIGVRKDGTRFPMEIRTRKMEYKERTVRFGAIRDITERKRAEEALRFHSEVMHNMAEGVVLSRDSDSVIVYTNPKFEEMFGYGSGELIGRNISVVNAPTDKSSEKVAEEIQNCLRKDGVWRGEVCNIKKDDASFWCYANVSAFKHIRHGDVWVSVHTDITERKQAEEKLRREEQRFRALAEQSSDIIIFVNREGIVTYENPVVEKLLGLKPAERIGVNLFDLIHPDDLKFAIDAFNMFTGSKSSKDINSPVRQIRLRHSNGGWLTFETSASKLLDDNIVEAVIINLHDITERKKAESQREAMLELLAQSEAQYRTFFKTSRDCVFITSIDGGWVDMNDAAIDLFGSSSRDELRSVKIPDLYANAEERTKHINAIIELGYTKDYPVDLRGKDGEVINTLITSAVRYDAEGKTIGFVGTIKNITERKKAEEKIKNSEAKYRNIFENAIEGIYQTTKEGRFITANAALARMAGYGSPEEFIESIKDIGTQLYVHPEDRKRFLEIMESKDFVNDFDVEFYRKDGSTFWAVINARTVKDERGRILDIEGLIEDITVRKNTEKQLYQTLDRLKKAVGTTIQILGTAVEVRDPYTAGHQNRVADLARAIATEMGISQDKIEGIRMASSIHDIGKLSIPAEILSKPTKLTNIEFSLIKEHAQSGYEMLKDVESPWPLAQIVYQHHERMNGSGYPRNMKGDEILIEARIMAVADVVEAMASNRPYRPTLGIEAALEEIEKNKGILYDATVADACLRLFREKGYQLT